jgi:predicted MPP superfamily phosphohydrolase
MKKRALARRPVRTALLFLILLAALAAFVRWDNCALQTEFFTFSSPRLPRGFEGWRVAVLTDLHGAVFGRENQALLDAVSALRPDAIAVVGDLVDEDTADPEGYAGALAPGLAAIAPVYYVTGNHEWAVGDVPALKTLLSDCGWTVLSNDFVTLDRGGDTLVLAGIDDPNGYADQKTPEALAREVRALQEPFWVLLAHRNDRFAGQYAALGADLVLSGHGHGGVIRLPGTDGLLGTGHDLFPSWTSGLYTQGASTLFVSRGLGNVGRTVRLFNRPQVALLTLHRA